MRFHPTGPTADTDLVQQLIRELVQQLIPKTGPTVDTDLIQQVYQSLSLIYVLLVVSLVLGLIQSLLKKKKKEPARAFHHEVRP